MSTPDLIILRENLKLKDLATAGRLLLRIANVETIESVEVQQLRLIIMTKMKGWDLTRGGILRYGNIRRGGFVRLDEFSAVYTMDEVHFLAQLARTYVRYRLC